MGSFITRICGSLPNMNVKVDDNMKTRFYISSVCCIRDDISVCINHSHRKVLAQLEEKMVDKKIELNHQHSISK